MNRQIYSISELTRKIKTDLEASFSQVWVEGEISNFSRYPSGHMYLSLKDSGSVLSAVLFRNVNKDLKFELKDGMQVVCFGKISVYEKRGQYQLSIFKIEPRGIGALQLAFEQLKTRLDKEGLFDQSRKRAIPFLPQRIGVVTSAQGAAIRDILHILDSRFSNLEVVVAPVRVQGQGASSEIAQAIDELNRFGRIDVMIVGRGGGSLEDLWAFNEEVVARAIFRSQIPVISAVGHEIDYTISDFVADFRAATPSHAAERVIARKQELIERIENLQARAQTAILNKIELLQQKLKRYVFRDPADLIQQYQQRVDELVTVLDLKVKHLLEINQQRSNLLVAKLQALSPLNILARGYSITFALPTEEVITTAGTLEVGAKIKTKVAAGSLISKIEQIKGEGSNGRD
ncbi:exodeoxyribonuclease VII large subunit [Candidatus Omnitrophota bacterium]